MSDRTTAKLFVHPLDEKAITEIMIDYGYDEKGVEAESGLLTFTCHEISYGHIEVIPDIKAAGILFTNRVSGTDEVDEYRQIYRFNAKTHQFFDREVEHKNWNSLSLPEVKQHMAQGTLEAYIKEFESKQPSLIDNINDIERNVLPNIVSVMNSMATETEEDEKDLLSLTNLASRRGIPISTLLTVKHAAVKEYILKNLT